MPMYSRKTSFDFQNNFVPFFTFSPGIGHLDFLSRQFSVKVPSVSKDAENQLGSFLDSQKNNINNLFTPDR